MKQCTLISKDSKHSDDTENFAAYFRFENTLHIQSQPKATFSENFEYFFKKSTIWKMLRALILHRNNTKMLLIKCKKNVFV